MRGLVEQPREALCLALAVREDIVPRLAGRCAARHRRRDLRLVQAPDLPSVQRVSRGPSFSLIVNNGLRRITSMYNRVSFKVRWIFVKHGHHRLGDASSPTHTHRAVRPLRCLLLQRLDAVLQHLRVERRVRPIRDPVRAYRGRAFDGSIIIANLGYCTQGVLDISQRILGL